MRDVIDLHTHTVVSEHAFSTVKEMVQMASQRGLEVLAFTEHAESCSKLCFINMRIIPRKQMGITVLHGAEVNIIDYDGHLDLADSILANLDIVIASMHKRSISGGTVEENTRGYLKAMKNPYVNIIGHPDDSRFPVDYKELVKGAKKYGKLLEVNNSSVSPTGFRDTSCAKENYRRMLEYCKEYETHIIIGSDAHIDFEVGNHECAMELVNEVDFPEHLIVNANPQILKHYLNYYQRGIDLEVSTN